MSGSTGGAVVRHGIESERANRIQKPFTPDSLGGQVRDAGTNKGRPLASSLLLVQYSPPSSVTGGSHATR